MQSRRVLRHGVGIVPALGRHLRAVLPLLHGGQISLVVIGVGAGIVESPEGGIQVVVGSVILGVLVVAGEHHVEIQPDVFVPAGALLAQHHLLPRHAADSEADAAILRLVVIAGHVALIVIIGDGGTLHDLAPVVLIVVIVQLDIHTGIIIGVAEGVTRGKGAVVTHAVTLYHVARFVVPEVLLPGADAVFVSDLNAVESAIVAVQIHVGIAGQQLAGGGVGNAVGQQIAILVLFDGIVIFRFSAVGIGLHAMGA